METEDCASMVMVPLGHVDMEVRSPPIGNISRHLRQANLGYQTHRNSEFASVWPNSYNRKGSDGSVRDSEISHYCFQLRPHYCLYIRKTSRRPNNDRKLFVVRLRAKQGTLTIILLCPYTQ